MQRRLCSTREGDLSADISCIQRFEASETFNGVWTGSLHDKYHRPSCHGKEIIPGRYRSASYLAPASSSTIALASRCSTDSKVLFFGVKSLMLHLVIAQVPPVEVHHSRFNLYHYFLLVSTPASGFFRLIFVISVSDHI